MRLHQGRHEILLASFSTIVERSNGLIKKYASVSIDPDICRSAIFDFVVTQPAGQVGLIVSLGSSGLQLIPQSDEELDTGILVWLHQPK